MAEFYKSTSGLSNTEPGITGDVIEARSVVILLIIGGNLELPLQERIITVINIESSVAKTITFLLNLFITLVLFNSIYPRLRNTKSQVKSLLISLLFTSENLILTSSNLFNEYPMLIGGLLFFTFAAGFFGAPLAGLLTGLMTELIWAFSGLTESIPISGFYLLSGLAGGLLSREWEKMLAGKFPPDRLAIFGVGLSGIMLIAIFLFRGPDEVGNVTLMTVGTVTLSAVTLYAVGKTTLDACQNDAYQKTLERIQQRYEGIINTQKEMVSRFTPDGVLTFTNLAYTNTFGDDLIGKNYLDFIPEEDRALESGILRDFSRHKKEQTYIHRAITKNGQVIWKERTSKAFFNRDGEVVEIQSVGRDITERRNAELALKKYREELEGLVEDRTRTLREINAHLQFEIAERKKVEAALSTSEKLYRKIFETTGTAMAMLSRDYRISLANDEFLQMLAIDSLQQLPETGFFSLLSETDRENCDRYFSEIFGEQKNKTPLELHLINRDGIEKEVLLYSSMTGETGQIILSLVDLTNQKRQQRELAETEDLARLALDSLPESIVILDQDGRILITNANWKSVINDTANENGGIGLRYFNLGDIPVIPAGNSRKLLEEGIRAVLAGNVSEIVVEYQRISDKTRYFLGKVRRFPHSNENRAIVAHEEITERVLIENQLRQARDELAMMLEISQKIVATIDLQPLYLTILEQLRQFITFDGACLISFEEDKPRCVTQINFNWFVNSERQCRKFMPIREVLESQKNFFCSDIWQEEEFLANAAEVFLEDYPFLRMHRSWMGIPLKSREKILGILLITHHRPDQYSYETMRLTMIYANIVSVAIDNAHLYQRVEQTAIDEERSRLARELHDSVSQTLFTASLIAEILPKTLEVDFDMGIQGAQELYELTQGALAEMRTLLLELRPAGLTEKSFGEILRQLVIAVQSRLKVPIELTLEEHDDRPLNPDLQIALYRITQEALNNIMKHASASIIEIAYQHSEDAGKLMIRDDGCGFDPNAIKPGTIGMMIMHERARQNGIDIEIESASGNGTGIRLSWTNNGKTG